jgi:DNA replication protein DnaC
LGEHLRKLRLLKSGERLEALLQQAAAQELPYADFLEQVLGEEVAAKTSRNITMRTAMARFPFVKPLETFEFSYQPSIDRKQVHTLASCHFIEHGDNVIVLGPRAWARRTWRSRWASRLSRPATESCSARRPT